MKSLSHARLFATPWTAAYQAPLSMGFSRQEYWSGLPLPSLKVATMNVSFIVTKTQVDLRASKITYWVKTINNCLFFFPFL